MLLTGLTRYSCTWASPGNRMKKSTSHPNIADIRCHHIGARVLSRPDWLKQRAEVVLERVLCASRLDSVR